MKHIIFSITITMMALLTTACGQDAPVASSSISDLTLTDGDNQQTLSLETLEEMPQTTATINDVDYIGVTLPVLLSESGVSTDNITAIKAIASDGFSANYDRALFIREDVILAYAQSDGPLTDDDGTFRMVLPGEEGRLNVRMVVEIQVVR